MDHLDRYLHIFTKYITIKLNFFWCHPVTFKMIDFVIVNISIFLKEYFEENGN